MRELSDLVSVTDQDVLPEILFYIYIKKKKIHKDQPFKTTLAGMIKAVEEIGQTQQMPVHIVPYK